MVKLRRIGEMNMALNKLKKFVTEEVMDEVSEDCLLYTSEIKSQIFYMYDELYNPTSYEWGNITDKEEIIRILNTYIDNYFDLSDKEVWFN